MSGRIYQFGQTLLPHRTARWQDPAQGRDLARKTLGGVFDAARGDGAGLELPQTVTVSALALADSAAGLGVTLDELRGLTGRRDRLWLDPYDTAQTDRWCWARLLRVNYTGSYDNRIWQPVDLIFQRLSGWQGHSYGGAWNLDAGYLFDSGLYFDGSAPVTVVSEAPITLPNAGNRTCQNVGVTYTADGGSPSVKFEIPGVAEWRFDQALAAGDVLTIDCGAKMVLLNGQAFYRAFSLGPNHRRADWLPLEPGGTDIIITTNEAEFAEPQVVFTYADSWM